MSLSMQLANLLVAGMARSYRCPAKSFSDTGKIILDINAI